MKKLLSICIGLMFLFITLSSGDCSGDGIDTAKSGVQESHVQIATGLDGKTAEQRNIAQKYIEDDKPGAIKHLYIISAYSGQVILYSTVKGKVTSGDKRLGHTLRQACEGYHDSTVIDNIGDDGTYGNSMDYLYWWDSKGVYHQQYVTGGMILHISSQPIAVKSIIINLEGDGDSK